MGFWKKISKPFKKIGKVISGGTRSVGNIITDPLGFKNIGKNIPSSYSLMHNINVQGKIDSSVNVSGQIGVDINVNLKDAITAASILRDGLTQFDLFGGAFRQHVNDFSDSQKSRSLLQELHSIISNGTRERKSDEYFFDLCLVNDSSTISNEPLPNHFVTNEVAACLAGIVLNGKPLIEDMDLTISKSANPSPAPPKIEYQVIASNIQTDNIIEFNVKKHPDDNAETNLLKNCRLQLRLLRETPNWKYTLAEWIFDGQSGPSNCKMNFVVEHPKLTACPHPSSKTTELLLKMGDLIDAISLPNIPEEIRSAAGISASGSPATVSSLIKDTLVNSFQSRLKQTEGIEKALRELEDEDPNTFDVRTPFVAAVSCLRGDVTVRISSGSGNVNRFEAVEPEVYLSAGDEMAIRLPLYAGEKVSRDDILEQDVRFTIHSPSGSSGRCTVRVFSGFEWATELVSARTIEADATDDSKKPIPFEVPILLTDALAD